MKEQSCHGGLMGNRKPKGRQHVTKGMIMKNKKLMLRQGDVLIVRIDEMPSGTAELPRTKRGLVLAEGEVTGHAHRIPSRSATLYRTEMDQRYMRVTAPVQLKHEEHKTVTIPPGDYHVSIHAEYQPGELPRRVAD